MLSRCSFHWLFLQIAQQHIRCRLEESEEKGHDMTATRSFPWSDSRRPPHRGADGGHDSSSIPSIKLSLNNPISIDLRIDREEPSYVSWSTALQSTASDRCLMSIVRFISCKCSVRGSTRRARLFCRRAFIASAT